MNLLASFIGLSLVTSPLVYISGHQGASIARGYERKLSLLMLVVLWVVFAGVVINFDALEMMTYQLGAVRLQMDGLSLLMSCLALSLATVTMVFAFRDIEGQPDEAKYYAMVFILTGMIIGLVCAGDLFNLWVWFEGTAISSYLLVAFYNEQKSALAACIKYFVQTAVGSILVLFGVALVLIQNGTLDLVAMQARPSPLLVIAGTLFVMGFGVKAALFPNFTWLPDAYAESPTGISAFLSGVVTVTGIVALLKALSVVMWSMSSWGALLLIIATLNIVIGNILALSQSEVKRILAYSSISHIGFIVLALGIGLISQSIWGMRAAVLHIFIHGLMKTLAFLAVGTFAYVRGEPSKRLVISDLKGVAQRYPGMAFALVIALLSLTGVPLLAGFVSKWQIFIAGIQSQMGWLIGLVIFAALNSVFSLAYYLPIINAAYDKGAGTEWQTARDLPLSMRGVVMLLAVLIVLIGVFPGVIDWLVNPATETLFALFQF